jgi:hypothetical protein
MVCSRTVRPVCQPGSGKFLHMSLLRTAENSAQGRYCVQPQPAYHTTFMDLGRGKLPPNGPRWPVCSMPAIHPKRMAMRNSRMNKTGWRLTPIALTPTIYSLTPFSSVSREILSEEITAAKWVRQVWPALPSSCFSAVPYPCSSSSSRSFDDTGFFPHSTAGQHCLSPICMEPRQAAASIADLEPQWWPQARIIKGWLEFFPLGTQIHTQRWSTRWRTDKCSYPTDFFQSIHLLL